MKPNLRFTAKLALMLTCCVLFIQPGWSQVLAMAQTFQPHKNVIPQDRPLIDVLNELKHDFQVEIMFEKKVIEGFTIPPNVVDHDQKLEKNLDKLLQPFGLKYKKVNKSSYLIIGEKHSKKLGKIENRKQEENGNLRNSENVAVAGLSTLNLIKEVERMDQMVTGKVTDEETGEGLPGATIMLKGTAQGTTTDFNGEFSISVPDENAVLVFSYIGYINQEITVGNQSQMNISMKADAQALTELVVIGYGEQRKSDLTGAVASIQTKDITRSNPIMAAKALQGQVAGATVTKLNNKPGTGYSITIRGENTINNSTEPLVVIDGLMGGNLNNLNPADIESINILKDASSTAIYGARGANGVVIVTTKKGISGKPRVSYDAYVGAKVPGHLPKLMSTPQFYKSIYTDRILEGGTGPTFTAAEQANIKGGITTDWVDLITQTGLQMSHNLSIAGGNEKTTYRFSGGFLNEDGNVKYTGFKRYNLNAGLDSKLGNLFKVGITTYVSYSDVNVGSGESLRNAYRARPTGTVYFKDLANPSENQDFNINGLAYWMGINDKQVPNPIEDINPNTSKLQTTNATLMGNAYVELAPVRGLTIRSSLSATTSNERAGDFRGQWSKAQIGAKPRAQYDQRTLASYTLDNILNYNINFNRHKFTFTALQSAFYQRNEAYQISVRDLPYNSDWYALNTAATVAGISSSLIERSLLSFMGRINYSFNEKYLLTLTGRSDGASQLSEGNKWAFFPSVAFAWRLGEEPFINDLNLFSNLKLRVSYGEVGNSTVNPYSTQAGVLNTGYDFDATAAYGFAPSNLGNKDLRWERSNEINLGVDFGFLRNRINASLELYNRKTVDLILNQKIPTVLGFSQVIANVGQIENKGVELTLNTTNITKENFSWNSTLTFTKNKNKLLQLYGEGQLVDKGNRLFVGKPIRANFDYEFNGIWQTADKELAAKYKQVPGAVRVVDQNNDGIISSTDAIDDRVYLGTQMPNWIAGITNRINYRNLDFSFFIYYRDGVQYNNSTLSGTFGDIGGTRYNKLASLDYWRSDNPSNSYYGVVAANPYRNAINYQDASFLRISDITFGYTLSNSMMDRWKLSNARFFAQASNPFVFSKFTGFDPEFNSAIFNDDVPSVLYTFGINLTF